MSKVMKPRTKHRKDPLKRPTLAKEYEDLQNPGKLKTRKSKKGAKTEEDEVDQKEFLSSSMSSKILKQALEQKLELENEEAEAKSGPKKSTASDHVRARLTIKDQGDDDDEGDDDDLDDIGEEEDMEEIELTAEDEQSLSLFMPQSSSKRQTIADLILEKIKEKEASASLQPHQIQEHAKKQLDPKIIEVYSKLAKFLSHYTSGKIPKAFKIIPTLAQWEEILILTQPEEWSAQALFAATKLFASNLNEKMAQRFYSCVLLPRIRSDIETHKKLNYHLYQSVKKAIFKPAAFFKGVLLPLAESGCTAREAIILSSILNKCSIPMLHSCVALMKLAQLPYSGPTTLFIRTLLNKKYNMPYKVLDAMVAFFHTFEQDNRKLPLIWHQALLVFVQRYKNDLSAQQRNQIRDVLRVQHHHLLTPEIRRELLAPTAINEERPQATPKQSAVAASQPSANLVSFAFDLSSSSMADEE